jgi:hypothetical protein
MLSLVGKLREVKKEIDAEKGGIVLLALFEREDASGKVDILFSAAWISRDKDERPALDYFTEKLRPRLTDRELLAISRVLVFQPGEPFIQLVLDLLREQGNPSHLSNVSLNGMLMTHAYILAADHSYSSLPAVADVEAIEKDTSEILDALHPGAAHSAAAGDRSAAHRGRSGRAVIRGRKFQPQ